MQAGTANASSGLDGASRLRRRAAGSAGTGPARCASLPSIAPRSAHRAEERAAVRDAGQLVGEGERLQLLVLDVQLPLHLQPSRGRAQFRHDLRRGGALGDEIVEAREPEVMAAYVAGHIDGPIRLLEGLAAGHLAHWAQVSTAFVCGRRSGTILERESDLGQALAGVCSLA